ncbi:hypothetical protein T09_9387 [Trichinella sp. T9]|uniref:Uncharacterized protein n=1 Tax=Trichinella murrelli TaxID=144512 RepID=A0A0V0U3Z0_9BILA|nr:hypothetical protein T05_14982 [Trichinella murrelli]KRX58113.1 hypothetical protein T09_9387 [Trichinella sp. T9]
MSRKEKNKQKKASEEQLKTTNKTKLKTAAQNNKLETTKLGLQWQSVDGVAVSMVAFQAIDPGSTPGPRKRFSTKFYRY